jgi:radical SAM protein with 4Fe4S-binding SPASM domain
MFGKIKYGFLKFRNKIFFSDFNSTFLKLNKVYPPYYVLWDCTRACNLNCKHCGAAKEKYKNELTTQQIKLLVDQLAELKVRFFAATGGEPLLRDDIFEVFLYASKMGIKTGIATNGFFIDKKTAEKIKSSGIVSVQVSLDGLEKTHNSIRGNQKSFQNAVNAIRFLKELKISIVSVATTITPLNIKELDGLKKIISDIGVSVWRISTIMPIGRASSKELMLSPLQLRFLLEWIIENKSRGLKISIGENLPFLGKYEKRVRSAPLICPVGFTACCIGTDGHVRGCPEQPDIEKYREGSILEKPFLEIWKYGFRRYRDREILNQDKKCKACKNAKDCFGGCWVMREGGTHCIHNLL